MTKPVIYYDGGCPVCAREIAFYRALPGAGDLVWQDVDSAEERVAADLSRAEALARLHARRVDGTLVSGAAAFALIWASLPRFAWAARLLEVPPVLWLAEHGYCFFLFLRRIWRRPGRHA
jgi:predicted DCC family thiol-disulfide oxidoreductase YuxK